uniref:Uncharacterized protein n=1 Tax=Caenorhabditis japonica TaxID=281687 RepID=A0A8R1DJ27_CAEJA
MCLRTTVADDASMFRSIRCETPVKNCGTLECRQGACPAMSHHSGDGEEGEIKEPARNDSLTHILYAQEAVGDDKKDSAIIDVAIEQFREENIGNIQPNRALASLGPHRIKQIVLGPSCIGVLLHDDSVCRIPFHIMQIQSGEIKETEGARGETLRMRGDEPYSRSGGAAEVEKKSKHRLRDISKPDISKPRHLETGHFETGHLETGHLETATSRNRVNRGRVVEKRVGCISCADTHLCKKDTQAKREEAQRKRQ